MRSLKFGVLKVWLVVGLLGLTLAGGGLMLAGDPENPSEKKGEQPQARRTQSPMWRRSGRCGRRTSRLEYESSLPVSVALLRGRQDVAHRRHERRSHGREVSQRPADVPMEVQGRWIARGGGVLGRSEARVCHDRARRSHPRRGDGQGGRPHRREGQQPDRHRRISEEDHRRGLYPVADRVRQRPRLLRQVVGRGPSSADTIGTIETSTVAKDAKPADVAAVPLAVDPKGRIAIMTGPRDATGEFTGTKGKNVLWAYVCGDYAKDSPGNRVMVGHTATVVSAAWSKEGSTAVTGDADGRVIVWDAKTMKESRRVELGGRVMAVAISDDGTHTAACVRGKQGGEVYVWETAKPTNAMKPIHTQQADFGSEPYASLTFSSDGKRLAGCAIDKKWLQACPEDSP